MMTNELENEPKLRFPEFNEEWEEKILDEVSTFSKGKGISKNDLSKDGTPCILYGELYTTYDFIINKIKSKTLLDTKNLVKGKKNQVLIPSSGETPLDIATAAVINTTEDMLLGGDINVLTPVQKYDGKFISLSINGKNKSNLSKYAQGKSVVHLYNNDIKKLKIKFPVKNSEQRKIGDFFSKLDRQIELEEQKLAKLEEQKKGYMQQIFSQKLRFKDENGSDYPNWEEVQLKYILIRRDHKQVPEINAPLMSFTSTGGIEPKGDRYNREFLVKNKNKKYKRTEFNDLIYSSNNLDVGAIGLNRYGTSVISDVYEIFKIEEQVSPYFIEMSILQPEFMYKILRYRQGALYGQYRIHANDFLKINIELPCSEEQYKIGDFVNKLDNIIDIINNKIELLKQRKRGFLQKMFI